MRSTFFKLILYRRHNVLNTTQMIRIAACLGEQETLAMETLVDLAQCYLRIVLRLQSNILMCWNSFYGPAYLF